MMTFLSKRASLHESVYGMTDVGMTRAGNEDAFLLLPDKQIFIVSDGMGGHNAGEVASKTAVDALETFFAAKTLATLSEEQIQETMINAVHEANRKVWKKGNSAPEYSGMGCTMVLVFIERDSLYVCHIGDSRVYLIDQKEIDQVTTDHSFVMELVQTGQLSHEEARHSYLKNQLTQALGTSETVKPEYNKRRIKKNDTVLLCSDGLWDMLDDREILKTVNAAGSPAEICKQLISKANEAGGNDNITVVVFRASFK